MEGVFLRSLERKARDCEDFPWPQQEMETCQPSSVCIPDDSRAAGRPSLPSRAKALLAARAPAHRASEGLGDCGLGRHRKEKGSCASRPGPVHPPQGERAGEIYWRHLWALSHSARS